MEIVVFQKRHIWCYHMTISKDIGSISIGTCYLILKWCFLLWSYIDTYFIWYYHISFLSMISNTLWRYTKLTNEPFKLLNNKKSCYKNLLQVLYFLISDCKRYMFLFPNNFSPSKKIFRVCALKKLCKNNIVIFFPTKYRQRKKTLQSINLLSYYCAISL